MAGVVRNAVYDRFAWFYSRGWGTEYHRQALGVLEKLLLAGAPAGARLLDVCCGTGDLARTLSERGYRVTGLDSSEPMLGFARRNAPAARFVLADAREFRLAGVFHGAVSTFDSLNHVLTVEELERVFRNVHGALVKGGVWVFDLNMAESFRTLWVGAGFTQIERREARELGMHGDIALGRSFFRARKPEEDEAQ
jgi:SAM-dependent methyltransferase